MNFKLFVVYIPLNSLLNHITFLMALFITTHSTSVDNNVMHGFFYSFYVIGLQPNIQT
jgi:hypothetical protein